MHQATVRTGLHIIIYIYIYLFSPALLISCSLFPEYSFLQSRIAQAGIVNAAGWVQVQWELAGRGDS